jgi:hypothetical protein
MSGQCGYGRSSITDRRAHPGALHTSLLHELGQIPLWGNHLVCKALFTCFGGRGCSPSIQGQRCDIGTRRGWLEPGGYTSR